MVRRRLQRHPRSRKTCFRASATEPDHLFNVHSEFQIPEDQKLAFQRERTGASSPARWPTSYTSTLGDSITLVGDIFPVTLELKVVGIFEEPDNMAVLYFNREYLREALGAGSAQQDMVGAFLIQADSAADVPAHRRGRRRRI